VARDYVPDRGDIVWLQFDPQAGHEQAGRPRKIEEIAPSGQPKSIKEGSHPLPFLLLWDRFDFRITDFPISRLPDCLIT